MRYTDRNPSKNKLKCNSSNSYIEECRHVLYIAKALRSFKYDGFNVKQYKYNLCDLLAAYDHIMTTKHLTQENTTFTEANTTNLEQIKTFLTD
eukprot:361208_1